MMAYLLKGFLISRLIFITMLGYLSLLDCLFYVDSLGIILIEFEVSPNMKDLPSFKETFRTYRMINMTSDILRKARQRELTQYGINPHQAAVLQIIYKLGGSATTTEISSQLLRERHSVHELLMRMVRAGFLKKIHDSNRKNGVRVEFTDRGLEAYEQAKEMKDFRKILSSLSKKQRKEFRKYYRYLLKASLENEAGLSESFLKEILAPED